MPEIESERGKEEEKESRQRNNSMIGRGGESKKTNIGGGNEQMYGIRLFITFFFNFPVINKEIILYL